MKWSLFLMGTMVNFPPIIQFWNKITIKPVVQDHFIRSSGFLNICQMQILFMAGTQEGMSES